MHGAGSLLIAQQTWKQAKKEMSIESSLLKRMVEPEDIAQGILFLAVNPAITGQTIVLDNGRLPT